MHAYAGAWHISRVQYILRVSVRDGLILEPRGMLNIGQLVTQRYICADVASCQANVQL